MYDEANSTYFAAIEEHFRLARGTGMFLLSSRDLALVEAWKNGGVPLIAVLRGIDAVFEKRKKNPGSRGERVNSLAYCAQAVAKEAQAAANATSIGQTAPPFSLDELRAFIMRNAFSLRAALYDDLAAALEALDISSMLGDLESLERELTAIEQTMIARALLAASAEQMTESRRCLDNELKPYRSKMTVEQIAMLEKQFLERRLLEAAGLPRLSLFCL